MLDVYLYLMKDEKALYGDNYKTLFNTNKVKFSPIVPYTIFTNGKTYLIIK